MEYLEKTERYITSVVMSTIMGLFYYGIRGPVIVYESWCLFCSFWFVLILNHIPSFNFIEEWMESFVLTRYTNITKRLHIPKSEIPKNFTPSISFMGGKY